MRPRVQALDENNKLKVVHRPIRLCLMDQDYPDRRSVEELTKAEVAKLKDTLVGTKLKPVAAGIKLGAFIEREYFPKLT